MLESGWPVWGYAAPLISGLIIPTIGALNFRLTEVVGSPIWAIVWSYGTATAVTVIWALMTHGAVRDGFSGLWDFLSKNWWNVFCLTGGLMGAVTNLVAGIIAGSLGVGFYIVGVVFVSALFAPVLDYTGFCWYKKVPVGWLTILGSTLLASGCVLHRFTVLNSTISVFHTFSPLGWYALATLMAGFMNVFQISVGGQLARVTGSKFRLACAWSFLSGFVVLVAVALIFSTPPTINFHFATDWWKLFAGLLCIVTLSVATISAMHLSAALCWGYIICGQLISATLIDASGSFGLSKRPLDKFTYIGLAVVLSGVSCITYSKYNLQKKRPFVPPSMSQHSPSSEVAIPTNRV